MQSGDVSDPVLFEYALTKAARRNVEEAKAEDRCYLF
jgi:hypothetical protein